MPFNWPSDDLTVKEKIGIGTEAPSEALDVKGSLKLNQGGAIDEFSSDGNFANANQRSVPTAQAVKTYVDTQVTAVNSVLATKAEKGGAPNQDFQTNNLNAQGNVTAQGNLDVTGAMNVIGSLHGKGVMAGIWAAQPLTDVNISTSGWVWQDVADTAVNFTLDRTAIVFCTYSINVQPDGDTRGEWLGTRLTVDEIGHRASGSHNQPYTAADSNVNLNANLVLTLPVGDHTVALQWMKPYNNVPSWSSYPSWGDGFIGARSLVVMAFYQ